MYQLTLTMPGEIILSANQRNTMHWATRHKLAKRIHTDLYYLYQASSNKAPEPLQRASVEILNNRARLLDPDNLVAGCKPYIDALVKIGVVIDDKPDNVLLKIDQAHSNKASRGVIIRITEVAK